MGDPTFTEWQSAKLGPNPARDMRNITSALRYMQAVFGRAAEAYDSFASAMDERLDHAEATR